MEQMRKFFSFSRLHRCRACGWRGWGIQTASPLPMPGHGDLPALSLDALDAQLGLLDERLDFGHTVKN